MDQNPKYKKVPRPESIARLFNILESRFIEIKKIDVQHAYLIRENKSPLLMHMTNIYIFSVSDFEEAIAERPDISVIVVMSNWNRYTGEVKNYAKERGIGLFTFVEFLGAVNYEGKRFVNYVPPEKNK